MFTDSTSFVDHQIQHDESETFFDKLRSVALTRVVSHRMEETMTVSASDSPGNMLKDLMESIRSSPSNSHSSTTEKQQLQMSLLKQIPVNFWMRRSLQHANSIRQPHINHTFSINTQDGNIFFDFSNQSIDYKIYLQLMQLVRSSKLDHLITKMFHKSGD